ncbi:MAG TPA: hypothetical protein PKN56_22120 [Leptospiraceae bacterium]|nr:hypothetical protein [Leptospiraceae bacterium]
MKKIVKYSFFLIILTVFQACQAGKNSELLESFFHLAYLNKKSTISGKATKGPIKNALVKIIPLRTNGECKSSDRSIAENTTDSSGNYSVEFQKTGKPVCVFVVPYSANTKMYDEASKKDLTWTDSSFYSLTVMKEPDTSKKKINITPFSRIAASRITELLKTNTDSSKLEAQVVRGNKEATIRFNLNKKYTAKSVRTKQSSVTGRNVTISKNRRNFLKQFKSVSDKDYPDLNDIEMNFDDPRDPIAQNARVLLAGFSKLANKTSDKVVVVNDKKIPDVQGSDVEDVIKAFSDDMADGKFDGKDSNGKQITISGNGDSKVDLSEKSLSGTLFKAVSDYVSDGGTVDGLELDTATLDEEFDFYDETNIDSEYDDINATLTIGGTVSGLTASGLSLDYYGEILDIPAGATAFTFAGLVGPDYDYDVRIYSQPTTSVICSIANNTGIVGTSSVKDIAVTCQPPFSFVDGNGATGLNFNTSANANDPKGLEFGGQLYLTWGEAATSQTRVKKFDGVSSWSFVDGGGATGINTNTGQAAANPILAVHNGTDLYAVWQEFSGGNQTMMSKRYTGGSSWTSAGAFSYSGSVNSYGPILLPFETELYAMWSEASSGVFQMRTKYYNSGTWTSAESATGLNYNSGQQANNSGNDLPTATEHDAKLYTAWTESNGTARQLHVSVYSGDTGAPSWTSVDGTSPVTDGINKTLTDNVNQPSLVSHLGSLYAAWIETSGGIGRVRVSVYNGDDLNPEWYDVDTSAGLNKDTTKTATKPFLIVYNDRLYVIFAELNGSAVSQIRVAMYNDDDWNPAWQFVDGNTANGINKSTAQQAVSPRAAIAGGKLYVFWNEVNASFNQIRCAKFNGN